MAVENHMVISSTDTFFKEEREIMKERLLDEYEDNKDWLSGLPKERLLAMVFEIADYGINLDSDITCPEIWRGWVEKYIDNKLENEYETA